MLRRSSRINSNSVARQVQLLMKGQSSTESYSGEYQAPKLKKSVPNRKLNQNLKNPYCLIQECPSIQLTTQQMQGNFLEFLAELQKQFSSYGAVKLMASQDWSPPFTFKYIDHGITTRNQILQDLRLGKVRSFDSSLSRMIILFYELIQAFQQNIEAHTYGSFKVLARQFEEKYQHVTKTDGTDFEQNEFQFWSLVTNPKYSEPEVEVEYAADIPTSKYCSAFPISKQSGSVDKNFSYHQSFYNLNNTFKDPDSLLKICEATKSNISGITQPWIYMGMKFSSFCWHVEDLYMNSLNYNHKGSTKTWYIIPESDKQKMDNFILEKCKHISKGKKAFIHRMTLMINPLDLIKQGIKVYKVNQSKKCYVVTFPKAYHCGFSQGFNLGEAVNYSILQTLPIMIQAEQEYKELNGKKSSVFPVQWIIDQNYKMLQFSKPTVQWKKAVTKQFQALIAQQLNLIKSLVKRKSITGFTFLDKSKTKYHKNPCATCTQYLYFSMLRCKKCLKIYCLDHTLSCCQEQFQIVLRELQKERQPLLKVLEAIGQ